MLAYGQSENLPHLKKNDTDSVCSVREIFYLCLFTKKTNFRPGDLGPAQPLPLVMNPLSQSAVLGIPNNDVAMTF